MTNRNIMIKVVCIKGKHNSRYKVSLLSVLAPIF